MVGDSFGVVRVGDDVVGESVGERVSDDVVGESVGERVGEDVVGESVGERVGGDVVGESVRDIVRDDVVKKSVGDLVGEQTGEDAFGESVGDSDDEGVNMLMKVGSSHVIDTLKSHPHPHPPCAFHFGPHMRTATRKMMNPTHPRAERCVGVRRGSTSSSLCTPFIQ